MKQINVLHVIDHIGMGGAQRIIGELFRKWDKENIELFCFVLRISNNDFDPNNKEVFHLSNHKSKYDIFSFFELKTFIEKKEIKILHLHLAKSILFGILIKIFYFKDVKIIIHEHGRIYRNNFWYNYLLKIFQSKVDLFIAVSRATELKLIENAKIKDDKIIILYNFVDMDYFNYQKIEIKRLEERTKIGHEGVFVLGFAGRLNKIKGCDILIKSIPYIKIQNFKLLIAGDGPEKNYLEKLSREINIEDKIHFCGYIKNILSFYRLIDCFVFSSRSEASPMAFYEVQALGIPIIANDVLALNEFIKDGENGLLFKTNSERDLAEKIELVHQNQNLRESLIINSLENAKIFSMVSYLDKIETLYYSLIGIQHYDK